MRDQDVLYNPVAFFWRQFGALEESWAKAWQLVLADEAYAKSMGYVMDIYLTNQQLLNKTLNDFIKKTDLTTTQDLASLASQVKLTEQKVITVLDVLERVQQTQELLLQLNALDQPEDQKTPKASKKKAKTEE